MHMCTVFDTLLEHRIRVLLLPPWRWRWLPSPPNSGERPQWLISNLFLLVGRKLLLQRRSIRQWSDLRRRWVLMGFCRRRLQWHHLATADQIRQEWKNSTASSSYVAATAKIWRCLLLLHWRALMGLGCRCHDQVEMGFRFFAWTVAITACVFFIAGSATTAGGGFRLLICC
ncbi:hypothetical protein ACLOJK_039267 [Asimina triloba]